MSVTVTAPHALRGQLALRGIMAAGACVVSIAAASRLSVPSLLVALPAVAFVALALWMFVSENLDRSCVALALYLGCVDGYAKLATGSSFVTLGRDLLLGAIVAGVLTRASIRGRRLPLPPLGRWPIAFAVLVLVQLFNPANIGLVHSLGGVRSELAFVPLFFFGYVLVQTRRRLRAFMVILVLCATANGIVSFIQLNLSPDQLAGWGPGYSARVNGTGDVSGRVFTDGAGNLRVRPFGLGADAGSGAILGVVSLGAALALLALSKRVSPPILLTLCIGPPLAIVTGQGRTTVVAGVVALLTFVVFATSARRLVPTLAGVLFGIGVTALVVAMIASNSSSGVFDRYKTIAPRDLVATTRDSRGTSIAQIPKYITAYPFGGGLGFVGPAASLTPETQLRGLNGETNPTFLLSELGVLGLIFMLAFNARLLIGTAVKVSSMDGETRILISGVAAGIGGLLATWPSGPSIVQSPSAPYFWFAAGILAFWLTRGTASGDVTHMATSSSPELSRSP